MARVIVCILSHAKSGGDAGAHEEILWEYAWLHVGSSLMVVSPWHRLWKFHPDAEVVALPCEGSTPPAAMTDALDMLCSFSAMCHVRNFPAEFNSEAQQL